MIEINFSSRKELPVTAGFSTSDDFGVLGNNCCRLPGVIDEERIKFTKTLTNTDQAAYLKQTHGTTLHYVKESGLCPQDGDAMWTDQKNLALSLHVADCIPLLFFLNDEEKPAIGVIHSGWKGAQANIVGKCLQEWADKGYDLSRAYAWMGPSICQDNYEFGDEAEEIFGDDYCSMAMGKTYLDLRGYVMDQLREGGILSSHIRYHASCTYDDDRLFSHRADPTTERRMFGMIMLT